MAGKGKQKTREQQIEEIEQKLAQFERLSRRLARVATSEEQRAAQGKTAVLVLEGARKFYAFRVEGEIKAVGMDEVSPGKADTILSTTVPKFLKYYREIENGDYNALARALARGDARIKGKNPVYDKLMWKEAFQRLARVAEVY